MNPNWITLLVIFVICLSVEDCMERADKAYGVPATQMYLQAAQVYAIQELSKEERNKKNG